MGKLTWKNPAPVVVIGGTEAFLVGREVRNAVLVTERSGRLVVWADSDGEVNDALTVADTFGEAALIVVNGGKVSVETLEHLKENQPAKTGLLIRIDGRLDEKKFPELGAVHKGFQVSHTAPTKKKDKRNLAVRFAKAEAGSLLGKGSLGSDLAEALVKAVGDDLGVISFEIAKVAALARSEESDVITVTHLRALVRPSSDIDLQPLREAMMSRSRPLVAAALDRIRRTNSADPTRLMLYGRGSPSDLALKWLRAAVLLESGATSIEIAARTGTPEWAVKRDVIPAAKRWGASALRDLVKRLSRADRGLLLGDPSAWISCETALLLGCLG